MFYYNAISVPYFHINYCIEDSCDFNLLSRFRIKTQYKTVKFLLPFIKNILLFINSILLDFVIQKLFCGLKLCSRLCLVPAL